MKSSIGHLFNANVTVLYVILDNPSSSSFNEVVRKDKQIVSCMSEFPFAFYKVIQDMSFLSITVTEVLKQFVELNSC